MAVISVIVGSTREGRFSEKPARWILQQLKKRDGVEARLLDRANAACLARQTLLRAARFKRTPKSRLEFVRNQEESIVKKNSEDIRKNSE